MRLLPLLGLLSSTAAFAVPITVHNTGVNASDVLVAPGAQTAFWQLSLKPAGASQATNSTPFRYHNPAYFADTAIAAWVSPGSTGNAGSRGNYVYDLDVDMTGLDIASAVISGIFGTDNDGSISLNGNAPVASQSFAGFGHSTNFTFNSGFITGHNTIHIVVNNGADPTAFFVQFADATANVLPPVIDTGSGNGNGAGSGNVPEPGTFALAIVGLAGLLSVRRRKA